jgi:ATP-dependent DNA helicase RecQ
VAADPRAVLQSAFGYETFRPGQAEVIEALQRRENVLAVMPTGSGKSLCYQIPALMSDALTIVVSPLISLMVDQVQALQGRGIAAAGIWSGLGARDRAETFRRLTADELRILYVSPERFTFEPFVERIRAARIAYFIIDEAHCVSHWGHDFRPEYLSLGNVVRMVGSPPVGAFTATATQEVRRDIEIQLGIEGATYVFTGFDRGNLALSVEPASTKDAKRAAVLRILDETPGSSIIYCSTRKETEEVARALTKSKISTVRYHAGLPDAERDAAQSAFLENRARVIVATCAFGMGIDKPDIRSIVHYSIPGSVEAYYQEIGRSGRDGKPSRCVLFWSYPDVAVRKYLIGRSENGEKNPLFIAAEERRLARMVSYARSHQCRRGYILDYFAGRHVAYRCAECDNCERAGVTPAEASAVLTADGSVPVAGTPPWPVLRARTAVPAERSEAAATDADAAVIRSEALEWTLMALSCIERIRRAEAEPTLRSVTAVLRGSRTAEVKAGGLDKLSTWNLMTGWSRHEVSRLFAVLRALRLIRKDGRAIAVSERGREVLFGREKIPIPFERTVVAAGMIVEKE